MFARVITADAGADGFDGFLDFAREQLPSAHQMPGFAGYYVLTGSESGQVMVISLWETREQMEAVGRGRPTGIRDEGAASATGLSSMTLETYEVALRA